MDFDAAVVTSILRPLRAAGLILRDAARAVRRAPSHAVMVAGVLAIGITAGTVTFSVVDAVLLKPLPIEDGDRPVFISSFDAKTRKERINGETFWQLHDHTQTLDGRGPWHAVGTVVAGPPTLCAVDCRPVAREV